MSLTNAQRAHLEKRLHDERQRALDLLNRSLAVHERETEEERSGDVSAMPTHQADLGTDTMQQEMDAADATRVSRELQEIDAALDRLVRTPASFGVCADTGQPIPFERLDMVPWARTCAEAELPRR